MIAPSREPITPALLVNSEAACEMLSISRATLARITTPHGALPAIRIGTGPRPLLRYRVSDLEAWVDDNCTGPRHGGYDDTDKLHGTEVSSQLCET